MEAQIAIGLAGIAAAGVLCLPAALRRYQQYRIWKADLPSIEAWAENDRADKQRAELIGYIYQHWPEAIAVDLQPRDPISFEERTALEHAPMRLETLLRIYRARPGALRVNLNPRQHKMQICDARKLGVPVILPTESAARQRQPRANDTAKAEESPLRHGRRSEPQNAQRLSRDTSGRHRA